VAAQRRAFGCVRPDTILFASARPSDLQRGSINLYTMRPDGSHPVRLTRTRAIELDPVWSPDGTAIAFTLLPNPERNQSDIYVMHADGSGRRRLTQGPGLSHSPTWSPDGKRIAYSRGMEKEATVCIMDANGTHARDLGPGFHPDWSPDGRELLFTQAPVPPKNQGLWPYRLFITPAPSGGEAIGGAERVVREVPAAGEVDRTWNAGGGVWSPDGKRIAFTTTSSRSFDRGIGIMNADGSELRQITHTASDGDLIYGPAWALDGKRLLFNRSIYTDRGWGPMTLCSIGADGKGMRVLRATAGFNHVGRNFLLVLPMVRGPAGI
jgi:TolB protein